MFRFLEVFEKGSKLFNSAAWKRGDITVSVLAGFLIAVVQLAGGLYPAINQYITQDVINAVAVVLLAIVNPLIHIATSRSMGVEPRV